MARCSQSGLACGAWGPVPVLALLVGALALVLAPLGLPAAEPLGDDDTWRTVEEWVQENLDVDALANLTGVDQERTRQFFTAVLRRFDANDVYDLASARQAAVELLPVLKEFEETRPYAFWLESRLDYFDASSQLRRRVTVVPPKRGAPAPAPLPSPTAEAQQAVWEGKLVGRPIPVRATPIVDRLKNVFASHGVPPELVWVAEVESSFNPEALSPKGAAGMFQLMPVTARSLGLATSPRDERLDAMKSAGAAARYLRQLHSRFGDWRLALAAYNAGETRLAGVLQRSRARGFYAIAPRLPAETQLYVPRVEATIRKREGVSLAALGRPLGPPASLPAR